MTNKYLVEIYNLHGKYYGTKINITHTPTGETAQIRVWQYYPVPSQREIDRHVEGLSVEDWKKNKLIKNPNKDPNWDNRKYIPAKEYVEACDHFESELSYEIAKDIKRALESIKRDLYDDFGV